MIHSIANLRIPERFPEIDAWATPVHKVANRSGQFYAKDLKDYLGLPSTSKLILSTAAPDIYQEVLWRLGPRIDYQAHGIDYWFPAHFSIYDDDSKVYQFLSAKRQMLHAALTRSHFIWFRLGEHIPVEFLNPIRNAGSVLLSTNQMYSYGNREILAREARIADDWFPLSTAFYVLGDPALLRLRSTRLTYSVSSNWLLRGIHGRDLRGRSKPSMSRSEVLTENLYEELESVAA